MTTVATGQVLLAGTSPAGLAASFAAPSGTGAITASANSLVDTSVGTNSAITLGSFASQTEKVSGTIDLSLGGVQQTALTLTAGSTVGSMIDQINSSSLGVTAKWVADGNNSFGSVQLTSNTAGTTGNITAATSTVTDTTATATLSYTAASAYNVGISGSIYDAASGQTAPVNSTANFTSDVKPSSGIATISYTDGAGQSLSATDLSNQTDAQATLTALNAAIIDVAAQDGYIGAQINTLNAVSSVLSTQQQNVVSAQNAVQATDYATAASNMSKYEILSQTGISALAQANSMQQEVTKLLQ
jgi:flagellin